MGARPARDRELGAGDVDDERVPVGARPSCRQLLGTGAQRRQAGDGVVGPVGLLGGGLDHRPLGPVEQQRRRHPAPSQRAPQGLEDVDGALGGGGGGGDREQAGDGVDRLERVAGRGQLGVLGPHECGSAAVDADPAQGGAGGGAEGWFERSDQSQHPPSDPRRPRVLELGDPSPPVLGLVDEGEVDRVAAGDLAGRPAQLGPGLLELPVELEGAADGLLQAVLEPGRLAGGGVGEVHELAVELVGAGDGVAGGGRGLGDLGSGVVGEAVRSDLGPGDEPVEGAHRLGEPGPHLGAVAARVEAVDAVVGGEVVPGGEQGRLPPLPVGGAGARGDGLHDDHDGAVPHPVVGCQHLGLGPLGVHLQEGDRLAAEVLVDGVAEAHGLDLDDVDRLDVVGVGVHRRAVEGREVRVGVGDVEGRGPVAVGHRHRERDVVGPVRAQRGGVRAGLEVQPPPAPLAEELRDRGVDRVPRADVDPDPLRGVVQRLPEPHVLEVLGVGDAGRGGRRGLPRRPHRSAQVPALVPRGSPTVRPPFAWAGS